MSETISLKNCFPFIKKIIFPASLTLLFFAIVELMPLQKDFSAPAMNEKRTSVQQKCNSIDFFLFSSDYFAILNSFFFVTFGMRWKDI
jgi:hypothetical protein